MCLSEVLLMSTHNIHFYGERQKIILLFAYAICQKFGVRNFRTSNIMFFMINYGKDVMRIRNIRIRNIRRMNNIYYES